MALGGHGRSDHRPLTKGSLSDRRTIQHLDVYVPVIQEKFEQQHIQRTGRAFQDLHKVGGGDGKGAGDVVRGIVTA